MFSSVSIWTYDSISANRSRSHFARPKTYRHLITFLQRPDLGCGQSLEPLAPNARSALPIVFAHLGSACSTSPCGYSRKSPRRKRSNRGLPVDVERGTESHAQSGALPRNHVRWRGQWYARGQGRGPAFARPADRECPGASRSLQGGFVSRHRLRNASVGDRPDYIHKYVAGSL